MELNASLSSTSSTSSSEDIIIPKVKIVKKYWTANDDETEFKYGGVIVEFNNLPMDLQLRYNKKYDERQEALKLQQQQQQKTTVDLDVDPESGLTTVKPPLPSAQLPTSIWSVLLSVWVGMWKYRIRAPRYSGEGFFAFVFISLPWFLIHSLISYTIMICFCLIFNLFFINLDLIVTLFCLVATPFRWIIFFFIIEKFRRRVIHCLLRLVEHYLHVLIDDFVKILLGLTLYTILHLFFPDYTWTMSILETFCGIISSIKFAWELTMVDWDKPYFWEDHPQGFWYALQHTIHF